MPSNLMERTSDGRRAKNRQRRYQESLVDTLKTQIQQRTPATFNEGDVVHTPLGYRRISIRYHNSVSGWQYQVLLKIEMFDRPRPYYLTYPESDLKPVVFKVGQIVSLPNKTKSPIAAIGLSPKFKLLIGFEVRPKCNSWYTEDDIYQYNQVLITPEYALRCIYRAYVQNNGDKELASQYALKVQPELAISQKR